ncbi:MAG: hypothetical protein LBC46_04675 [Treponema sp.]|nr:hypothetical protein [Treponema sp.]
MSLDINSASKDIDLMSLDINSASEDIDSSSKDIRPDRVTSMPAAIVSGSR